LFFPLFFPEIDCRTLPLLVFPTLAQQPFFLPLELQKVCLPFFFSPLREGGLSFLRSPTKGSTGVRGRKRPPSPFGWLGEVIYGVVILSFTSSFPLFLGGWGNIHSFSVCPRNLPPGGSLPLHAGESSPGFFPFLYQETFFFFSPAFVFFPLSPDSDGRHRRWAFPSCTPFFSTGELSRFFLPPFFPPARRSRPPFSPSCAKPELVPPPLPFFPFSPAG